MMDMNSNACNNHMRGIPQEPCNVKLLGEDLWQKFHSLQTEMIVTKNGRRMFPSVRVEISNLEPSSYYCLFLEFVPVNHYRYKYSNSTGWITTASEEMQNPNRIYLHPDSPATGEHWMSQIISFGRIKLTNAMLPASGQVILSSMHKYRPQIVIAKTMNPNMETWTSSMCISFPETQFIAVTAYQNEEITKLKIDNNPFAKGFRENGRSSNKRKYSKRESEQEITEEIKSDDSLPDTSSNVDVCEDQQSIASRLSSSDMNLIENDPTTIISYPTPTNYNNYNVYRHSYNPYLHPLTPSLPYKLVPPSIYNYYYNIAPYLHPFWNMPYNYTEKSSIFYGEQVPSASTYQPPISFTDFSVRKILDM